MQNIKQCGSVEKNLPAVWETGSIPGSGRFPWRRKWLLTPVFLPGEFNEEEPGGYSPWDHKMSERLSD